jgi:hypothetical protein
VVHFIIPVLGRLIQETLTKERKTETETGRQGGEGRAGSQREGKGLLEV